MKFYLLICGYNYYPNPGTGDWVATFETHEEAKKYVSEIEDKRSLHKYKLKNGDEVDWYEIIDLRKWVMRDNNENQ